jgi:hypothetical protein
MFMSHFKFAEHQQKTIERMAYDLQSVIGKIGPDNHSATLRSKLISIDTVKGTCILEIVPTEYVKTHEKIGHQYEQAIQIVHNGYFY